eukprot:2258179-Pyramimonas_sp.AAC.3
MTVSSPTVHRRLERARYGHVLGTRPGVATHGAELLGFLSIDIAGSVLQLRIESTSVCSGVAIIAAFCGNGAVDVAAARLTLQQRGLRCSSSAGDVAAARVTLQQQHG